MKQSKSINFARHFLKYNWVGNKCGKTYLKSTTFILFQQLFQTGGLYQLQKIQILSHKMGTNFKLAASTEFSLGVAPKPSSIPKQRLQQRDYKMWSLVILDYTISFSFYREYHSNIANVDFQNDHRFSPTRHCKSLVGKRSPAEMIISIFFLWHICRD